MVCDFIGASRNAWATINRISHLWNVGTLNWCRDLRFQLKALREEMFVEHVRK